MPHPSPPDPFSFLIQTLSLTLGPISGINSAEINPATLQSLMTLYTSNPIHWSPYALADPSRNYTRNLVDEGNGKSNLLLIVWEPGKGSPIHDHADAHCAMKILSGSLEETLYATPSSSSSTSTPTSSTSTSTSSSMSSPSTPLQIQTTTYKENQVTCISDQIGLHKITNPSPTEQAVSLHLYTPPHAATFGFNLFDEWTGKATHIKQAGFFSNRGTKCEGRGMGTECL